MYSLLRMNTFTGKRYWARVDISWMFIMIDASPAMSTTSASGWAICTPIAAGRPYPMVPSPPDVSQWLGFSKPKCWAAHIWCWPTSVVM